MQYRVPLLLPPSQPPQVFPPHRQNRDAPPLQYRVPLWSDGSVTGLDNGPTLKHKGTESVSVMGTCAGVMHPFNSWTRL